MKKKIWKHTNIRIKYIRITCPSFLESEIKDFFLYNYFGVVQWLVVGINN